MAAGTAVDDARVYHIRSRERRKLARRMASLAGRAEGQVVNRGGNGCDTGVNLAAVTARTAADDARVYHRRARERGELARRMAGLASRASRQMSGGLRHRSHPVEALPTVAERATAEYARMVHHPRTYAE